MSGENRNDHVGDGHEGPRVSYRRIDHDPFLTERSDRRGTYWGTFPNGKRLRQQQQVLNGQTNGYAHSYNDRLGRDLSGSPTMIMEEVPEQRDVSDLITRVVGSTRSLSQGGSRGRPPSRSESSRPSSRQGERPPSRQGRNDASIQFSNKSGRVKVAVRCRPVFEDELAVHENSVVVQVASNAAPPRVAVQNADGDVQGHAREYYYDHCFGPQASQQDLYDTVAGPIVQDVLRGINGTVLAYGQTGTGKTYTMGILDRIDDQHAGIIPRSLSHIFGHISSAAGKADAGEWSICISFLQIYLEQIQDLFAFSRREGQEATAFLGSAAAANLQIRENPGKGFYVEGLRKYSVSNYSEAIQLLNAGLENRAMAPTLMNTTSSRSHTILTIEVEHRIPSAGRGQAQAQGFGGGASAMGARRVGRTRRGKLLLVDLAGSERARTSTLGIVSRSSRRGGIGDVMSSEQSTRHARFDESKSINVSLSALGNVIAALADNRSKHVPYRDSKLTRIMQDSLGGRANTVLIATVGPTSVNRSETLSTLQFASRCMHVKSAPITNEEVDYADLCAHLQEKLAKAESEKNEALAKQAARYEEVVEQMSGQIETMRGQINEGEGASSNSLGMERLQSATARLEDGDKGKDYGDLSLLRNVYETVRQLFHADMGLQNLLGEFSQKISSSDEKRMRSAVSETLGMESNDPHATPGDFGPHIADAASGMAKIRERIRRRYNMELDIVSYESVGGGELLSGGELAPASALDNETLVSTLNAMLSCIKTVLSARSDRVFAMQEELAEHEVERKKREEEMVNWSYVLKYLLSTNSKLRQELRAEQKQAWYKKERREGAAAESTVSPLEDVDYEEEVSQDLEGELPVIKASLFLESIGAGPKSVEDEGGRDVVRSPTYGSVEAKGAGGEEFVTPVSTVKIRSKPMLDESKEMRSNSKAIVNFNRKTVRKELRSAQQKKDKKSGSAKKIKKVIKKNKGAVAGASGMFETISPPKLNSPKFSQLDLYLQKVKRERKERKENALSDVSGSVPSSSLPSSSSSSSSASTSPSSSSTPAAKNKIKTSRTGSGTLSAVKGARRLKAQYRSNALELALGGSGWLMRRQKRGLLNGSFAWEPLYFELGESKDQETANVKKLFSYRLASHQGSIPLAGADVMDLSPRGPAEPTLLRRLKVSALASKREHLFAVRSSASETKSSTVLLMTARNESSKQEWIAALRHAVAFADAAGGSISDPLVSKQNGSGALLDVKALLENAMAPAIFQGILTKRSTSSSALGGYNWKTRFFKIDQKKRCLEWYTFMQQDSQIIDRNVKVTPTTLSVHDVAVHQGVNPVWFQNRCRFTFSIESAEHVLDLGTGELSTRAAWIKTLQDTSVLGGATNDHEYVSPVIVERTDPNTGRVYRYDASNQKLEWLSTKSSGAKPRTVVTTDAENKRGYSVYSHLARQ